MSLFWEDPYQFEIVTLPNTKIYRIRYRQKNKLLGFTEENYLIKHNPNELCKLTRRTSSCNFAAEFSSKEEAQKALDDFKSGWVRA